MHLRRPLLEKAGELIGITTFFSNFVTIAVLLLAWVIVLPAFFVLAVQLFIAIIEFKLTTLAGFVLVPFALFGQTAFLAERVLGNVISSGIKLMVLAIVVGIGSSIFGTLVRPTANITLTQAASTILAATAVFGLAIFVPGIAAGLITGAPQLGAGAAVATTAAAGGTVMAGGMLTSVAARLASRASGATIRAAASDRAAVTFNEHARENDPFARVGRETVSVEVTSVVRASNTSFQVRWLEPVPEKINAIQVYPYTRGALYQLYAAPNQVTDIALEPGEKLTSVSAGGAQPVMMENDAPEAQPPRPQAANDNNGASAAPIDARILTIARALGRQIAREQLKRMRAANDNDRPEKR